MHDLERIKPYGRAVDRVIRYGCMNLVLSGQLLLPVSPNL